MIQWYENLVKGLACVAAIILIFMTVSIDYEVIMRYFFNSPTSWVVDFSEYALVYITFLSGAWVLITEGHVKVEIVLKKLPILIQNSVNIITSILGALVFFVLFWYSLTLTLEAFEAKSVFIKPVSMPVGPVYLVMPIGFILMALGFLRRTRISIIEEKNFGKAMKRTREG